MKVLHLLTSKIFSGAENVVYQIMTMTKDEKDLSMVYVATDGPVREELEKREVSFELLPVVNVKNVKEAIRHQKPDLIHAHDMKAGVIAALSCGKIPLVCHIHNNDPANHKISIKSLAFLIPASKAKKIFWVSKSACDSYLFQRIFRKKSKILQNIVNTDLIRKKSMEPCETEDYDILFIGRFEVPKNPQRFLRIVKKVSETLPNVKAVMLGEGSIPVKENRNIRCLGFLSNPYPVIRKAKVMLMTSDWEGLPMSALEAMALGVPIVTTPVDGMKDVIENGVNGYIESSEEALAEKVTEILSDNQLRTQLSGEQLKKAVILNDTKTYIGAIRNAYGIDHTKL